jgi:hypothetical protein
VAVVTLCTRFDICAMPGSITGSSFPKARQYCRHIVLIEIKVDPDNEIFSFGHMKSDTGTNQASSVHVLKSLLFLITNSNAEYSVW